jgi:hypothetical protein
MEESMATNSTVVRSIRFAVGIGALFGALSVADSASAGRRNFPGHSGHIIQNEDLGCFAEAYGTAKNLCGPKADGQLWRYWQIPLIWDNSISGPAASAGVGVRLSTDNPSVARIYCYAYAVNSSWTGNNFANIEFSGTAEWGYPLYAGYTSVSLGTVYFPSVSGYGILNCRVYQNAQVNSAYWQFN